MERAQQRSVSHVEPLGVCQNQVPWQHAHSEPHRKVCSAAIALPQAKEHLVPELLRSGHTLTLQDLVEMHILANGRRCFVVTDDSDQVVGLLTLHHLSEIPKADWPAKRVGQAMTPLGRIKWLQPTTPVKAGLEEMDQDGVNQLPVMSNGQILGMLTREDIISFLRTQAELGLHHNRFASQS